MDDEFRRGGQLLLTTAHRLMLGQEFSAQT
jgi:hypothetical protein